MNSSLKQPLLSGKLLNDGLIKVTSALVDMFVVTLGIQKFQYALTKVLSKIYQRVQAAELAKHVRKIIWRGGNLEQDPDVYSMSPPW
jgi:hypothetical protein